VGVGEVAVAAWADAATDDDRLHVRVAFPNGDELIDRGAVDPVELDGAVADGGAPLGVRPPCRRLEHGADAVAPGDVDVVLEVGVEQLAPPFVVEQRERGERRQVDIVVEDEIGLEPAVGSHRPAVQLRQLSAVAGRGSGGDRGVVRCGHGSPSS